MPETTEHNENAVLRAIVGLFLLLPAAGLCFIMQVWPAFATLQTSMTDDRGGLGRETSYIGMENYERMLSDPLMQQVLGYTLLLLVLRLLVVALVPPLVGLLLGVQGGIGRGLNRMALALVGVLLAPTALAVLWAMFWRPLWGREPSPLPESLLNLMLPRSIDSARFSTLTLDLLITAGIAVAVGATVWMMVMRGRGAGLPVGRAALGAWLLGLLLTFVSTWTAFDTVYITTQGGPAGSTMTYLLMMFRSGFANFNFGYTAALAVPAVLLSLLVGLGVWAVVSGLRLRLSFTPAPRGGASLLSLVTLPGALLLLLPLCGLLTWGALLGFSGGSGGQGLSLDWGTGLVNGFLMPGLAIWLVQLPVTYAAGFALGFLRPLGGFFSGLIFLLFLLFAFVPSELLMIRHFETMRSLNMLGTHWATLFLWLYGGLSLLVFKLFFEGTRVRYAAALREGASAGNALFRRVLLPSVPVALVVGFLLSFIASQQLFWPLAIPRGPDTFTLPVQLARIMGTAGPTDALASSAALSFAPLLLIFLPVAVLLHWLVLDRLALLGGKPRGPGERLFDDAAPAEDYRLFSDVSTAVKDEKAPAPLSDDIFEAPTIVPRPPTEPAASTHPAAPEPPPAAVEAPPVVEEPPDEAEKPTMLGLEPEPPDDDDDPAEKPTMLGFKPEQDDTPPDDDDDRSNISD